jgi:hypothetical protein
MVLKVYSTHALIPPSGNSASNPDFLPPLPHPLSHSAVAPYLPSSYTTSYCLLRPLFAEFHSKQLNTASFALLVPHLARLRVDADSQHLSGLRVDADSPAHVRPLLPPLPLPPLPPEVSAASSQQAPPRLLRSAVSRALLTPPPHPLPFYLSH